MFDEKKFIENVRAVKTGNSDMRCCEIVAIREMNKNDMYGALCDAFRLGLRRGRNEERRKHVKKSPTSDVERRVQWLHAEIDRRRDDEPYINSMVMHSRALYRLLSKSEMEGRRRHG